MNSRTTYEARWIAPASGAVDAFDPRPTSRSEHRIDRYYVPSLSPSSAIKLRDGQWLESKERVGRRVPFQIVDCPGIAEHWVKRRIDGDDLPGDGSWLDVTKEVWDFGPFQLCLVSLDGSAWWSIGLRANQLEAAKRSKLFRSWAPLLCDALAASFPAWLAATCHLGGHHR